MLKELVEMVTAGKSKCPSCSKPRLVWPDCYTCVNPGCERFVAGLVDTESTVLMDKQPNLMGLIDRCADSMQAEKRAQFEAGFIAEKLRLAGAKSGEMRDAENSIRTAHLSRTGSKYDSLEAHMAWWAWQTASSTTADSSSNGHSFQCFVDSALISFGQLSIQLGQSATGHKLPLAFKQSRRSTFKLSGAKASA